MNRIDPVQAAREHKPAALARVVAAGRPSSGRDAENSWGGDDSKRDESLHSTHGGFLLVTRRQQESNLGHARPEARAPRTSLRGERYRRPLDLLAHADWLATKTPPEHHRQGAGRAGLPEF